MRAVESRGSLFYAGQGGDVTGKGAAGEKGRRPLQPGEGVWGGYSGLGMEGTGEGSPPSGLSDQGGGSSTERSRREQCGGRP